jgi:hypothetical protein
MADTATAPTTNRPREYALRAIREGRVCVVHARSVPARDAVPYEVLGRVVGHNGVYSVGYRSGTWSCSCGTEQPCGHRTAVALIVGQVVTAPAEAQPSATCAWCRESGHHEDYCPERAEDAA